MAFLAMRSRRFPRMTDTGPKKTGSTTITSARASSEQIITFPNVTNFEVITLMDNEDSHNDESRQAHQYRCGIVSKRIPYSGQTCLETDRSSPPASRPTGVPNVAAHCRQSCNIRPSAAEPPTPPARYRSPATASSGPSQGTSSRSDSKSDHSSTCWGKGAWYP
jgi:hypothetical protein